MEELPKRKGPYHLLLVGDGDYRDQVEQAAEDRPDITWLSYISDQDRLARLYSAADLFVSPGTHETFGFVSVEVQACGTRVLGVRDTGMDETLKGEDPLIMAEEPTPAALAAAIERSWI